MVRLLLSVPAALKVMQHCLQSRLKLYLSTMRFSGHRHGVKYRYLYSFVDLLSKLGLTLGQRLGL